MTKYHVFQEFVILYVNILLKSQTNLHVSSGAIKDRAQKSPSLISYNAPLRGENHKNYHGDQRMGRH
jgi:hypothetical protein